ncbi:hypothetical protein CZ794_11860 [Psychrobacter sp. JB385]|nr:hypothetical protein CZ794_11860 [Psychrobacter sp. JB385]
MVINQTEKILLLFNFYSILTHQKYLFLGFSYTYVHPEHIENC